MRTQESLVTDFNTKLELISLNKTESMWFRFYFLPELLHMLPSVGVLEIWATVV